MATVASFIVALILFVNGILAIESILPLKRYRRMTYGRNAENGAFPWQVTISFWNVHKSKISYCGGSIISDEWVLTAAHCVSSVKNITLRFGSNDVDFPAEIMNSSKIIVCPAYKFNDRMHNCDIAVVKLPRKIIFDKNINLVNLPPAIDIDNDEEELFENRTAYFSGFGRTDFNEKNITRQMQWISLTVISNAECAKSYKPHAVPRDILCTVGFNHSLQGPCPGDSGGPLVLKNQKDEWMQIGVMVFTAPNSCSGVAAGYVRLTFLQQWIREQIENSDN